MAFSNTDGHALSWDDAVSAVASEYTLLPEGRYKATLANIQLGQYGGGTRMGACPQATATFKIETPDGQTAQINDNFFMWSTVLWKSAQLFSALGLPKNAEGGIDNIPPTWARRQDDLIGRTCWVNIIVDEYTGSDGKKHQNNKIKSYTDKAPANAPAPTPAKKAAPAAKPAPAKTSNNGGWGSW